MNAFILAGGLGARLSAETVTHPKPTLEIDGKKMLRHIMKGFTPYGI